jgi:hypothetical protein
LFLKEHRPTFLKSSCPGGTGCPIKRIDRLSVNVTLPLSLDRSCICRRRFLQCSLLDKLRRNQIHTCLQVCLLQTIVYTTQFDHVALYSLRIIIINMIPDNQQTGLHIQTRSIWLDNFWCVVECYNIICM